MLKVEQVDAGYGDVQVLVDVSLEVGAGESVALVGANGAGKTTLLCTVSGLVRPRRGQINFAGESIAGLPPERIVALGLSHVPQGRRLFPGLTVRDNLLQGAYLRRDAPAVREDLDRVLHLFPRLKERLHHPGGSLSGGEQQMCAIGRGLMARPKLLMVDEVSLGLAPVVVEAIYSALAEVRRSGTAVLIVEQDVQTALEEADRAYVLSVGRIALSGPAADLLHDPSVQEAFLGVR